MSTRVKMSNGEKKFWRAAWGIIGLLSIVAVALLMQRGHENYLELVRECEARPGGGSTHSSGGAFGVMLLVWCAVGALLSPVFLAARVLGLDRS